MYNKKYKCRCLVTICVLLLCYALLMTSCTGSMTKDDMEVKRGFATRVNYEFSVPLSTDDSKYACKLDVPLWYIYVGNENYMKILNDNTQLFVGEGVKLKGEGTEQLDGCEFYFECKPLSQWFDDKEEFLELISEEYKAAYGEEFDSKEELNQECDAAIAKIDKYFDNSYVCFFLGIQAVRKVCSGPQPATAGSSAVLISMYSAILRSSSANLNLTLILPFS